MKHYVSVMALFRIDGWVTPLEIIWDDGRRFSLEVVDNGRRTRCDKTPGYAVRFKVRIHGVTRNLYKDDVGWFVETPEGAHTSWPSDPRLGGVPG